MNGKGDAVAEPVIGRAAVGLDQETAFDQVGNRRAGGDQLVLQGGAAVRRKTDPVAHAVLARQSARFEIASGIFRRRRPQGAQEEGLGTLHPFDEGFAMLGLLLALRVGLRQAKARLTGQALGRLHEGEAFHLLQPGEDIAMLAGGEAMVETLVIIDEKGRRPLFLEGRQTDKFAALAFQRHRTANEVRRAHTRLDLVDKVLIETHGIASPRPKSPIEHDAPYFRVGRFIRSGPFQSFRGPGEKSTRPTSSMRFSPIRPSMIS